MFHPHLLPPSYTHTKTYKKCLARERTEKAIVMTKKQNFHHIKRRTLAVEYHFYFFQITYKEKFLLFQNPLLIVFFKLK